MPKTTPPSRPSSDDSGVEWPDHQDQKRRTVARMSEAISGNDLAAFTAHPGCRFAHPGYKKERTEKRKRKQNADRRGSPCFTLRRSAHPAQGALACRRSTAVLPKGLTHPLVRLRTRLRGAGAKSGGGLPPAPAPVTASTSQTGHSAGRHDVRTRPSTEVTKPPPAGAAPRSRQPSSPAGVLARGARGRHLHIYRDYCQ